MLLKLSMMVWDCTIDEANESCLRGEGEAKNDGVAAD